jgi:NAD-reducing hydrogenase small subunit
VADAPAPRKLRVATCSLAGCFGCHMSLLDIDERIATLVEHVEFDRSPFDDLKVFQGPVDVGFIEGGAANAENVHVLREFRSRCRILVAVGACAINGNIPAIRNSFTVKSCLEESFIRGVGVENAHIPDDPELPLLLDKVRPVHEIVRIDHSLPGCPPSADVIWAFFTDLIAGRVPAVARADIRFD